MSNIAVQNRIELSPAVVHGLRTALATVLLVALILIVTSGSKG